MRRARCGSFPGCCVPASARPTSTTSSRVAVTLQSSRSPIHAARPGPGRATLAAALAALAALAACARQRVGEQGAASAALGAADTTVPAGPLPLKLAPRPTGAAISARDLMTRIYVFADDSMEGREAATAGNLRGNQYIARELRRLGLRPAGENGDYFQAVQFSRRGYDPNATVSVE